MKKLGEFRFVSHNLPACNGLDFQTLTFFITKYGQALDLKVAYIFKIFKDLKLLRSFLVNLLNAVTAKRIFIIL